MERIRKFPELSDYEVVKDSIPTPNVCWCVKEDELEYNKLAKHDYSKDYLTFETIDDCKFKSSKSTYYSLDNGTTWTSLASNTDSPTVSAGNKIMFKAEITPQVYSGVGKFSSTGKFNAMGNVMSLLYGDNFIGQTSLSKIFTFYGMFFECSKLTNAENLSLPATTLADYCYMDMFNGCTSLTTAPQLPATTLTFQCYYYMFKGCTSLTTALELPATTLAGYCYSYMFSGCTSLVTAPALPATTLASNCYMDMFNGCTSLTTAPSLLATTLAYSCYSNMFRGCTSLQTAPALLATTLANWCYNGMFGGCTSLTTAPALPATTLANYCYYGMFQGCTSLTTAPELPAETLVDSCYYSMFSDCTSLNKFTIYALTMSAFPSTAIKNCLSNVASSGVFIQDRNSNWGSLVPNGWEIQYYD